MISGLDNLQEEFVASFQTFFSLLGTQAFQTLSTGVEYRPRAQTYLDQIVAIMFGKDEVVLPAIETPAEQRAAMIDGASGHTEVYALAIVFRRKKKYGITG